jgi:hypothetical protein
MRGEREGGEIAEMEKYALSFLFLSIMRGEREKEVEEGDLLFILG